MRFFNAVMDSAFSVAGPYCSKMFASPASYKITAHQMTQVFINESEEEEDWNIVEVKHHPSSMKKEASSSSSPKKQKKQVKFNAEVQVKYF